MQHWMAEEKLQVYALQRFSEHGEYHNLTAEIMTADSRKHWKTSLLQEEKSVQCCYYWRVAEGSLKTAVYCKTQCPPRWLQKGLTKMGNELYRQVSMIRESSCAQLDPPSFEGCAIAGRNGSKRWPCTRIFSEVLQWVLGKTEGHFFGSANLQSSYGAVQEVKVFTSDIYPEDAGICLGSQMADTFSLGLLGVSLF